MKTQKVNSLKWNILDLKEYSSTKKITMTTFNKLISAAKEKGFKFEAFTTVFDRWGDETLKETTVQINIEDHVWYSWTFRPGFDIDSMKNVFDENAYSIFEGRYNQANGANQATFRKERKGLSILGL